MEIIVSAKDCQTAEANKKASLLEELDKECVTQEKKKAVAAKRREKKKKKKEKQEKEKETTKSSTPEPETDWKDKDDEMIEDQTPVEPPSATVTSLIGIALPTGNEPKYTKAIPIVDVTVAEGGSTGIWSSINNWYSSTYRK